MGGVVEKYSGWVMVGISMFLLLGGMSVSYSNLNSKIAVIQEKVHARELKDGELDVYDAYLSRGLDTVGDRVTRVEASQEGILKNQERIEKTMNEILKEMKAMNENIIRIGG